MSGCTQADLKPVLIYRLISIKLEALLPSKLPKVYKAQLYAPLTLLLQSASRTIGDARFCMRTTEGEEFFGDNPIHIPVLHLLPFIKPRIRFVN